MPGTGTGDRTPVTVPATGTGTSTGPGTGTGRVVVVVVRYRAEKGLRDHMTLTSRNKHAKVAIQRMTALGLDVIGA